MKLVLALPEGGIENVDVVVHGFYTTPVVGEVARDAMARAGSGTRADVSIVSNEEGAASTGWPTRTFEATVKGQHVVCVAYHFLEYSSVATANFGTNVPSAETKQQVLDVLSSGRPDFTSDSIVALSELFDDQGPADLVKPRAT